MTRDPARGIVQLVIDGTRAAEEQAMREHIGGNGIPAEVVSLDWWASHRGGDDGSRTIRVLLADGAGLVRAGLRKLLDGEQGISVVAEAGRGEDAVALAIETRPDVVLIDVRLPGLDGLQAIRQILANPGLSEAKILVLSDAESDEDVFAALRAGATGFLVRDTDPVELRQAVRVLVAGGAQLSPRVTRRLLAEFAAQPHPDRPPPQQLEELTAREREVMTLVALGLTNDEIAERLVVSPATAKTHVSRAMVKLHVRDRAKLVALAYETGFVRPRVQNSEIGFGPADRASSGPLRSRRPGNGVTTGRPTGGSGDVRVRSLRLAGVSVLARQVDHPQ